MIFKYKKIHLIKVIFHIIKDYVWIMLSFKESWSKSILLVLESVCEMWKNLVFLLSKFHKGREKGYIILCSYYLSFIKEGRRDIYRILCSYYLSFTKEGKRDIESCVPTIFHKGREKGYRILCSYYLSFIKEGRRDIESCVPTI